MRPKVRKGLHGRKGELSMNKKKLPLAFWIFIGLVVGIAVGLALMMVPNGLDIAKNYILPWGTIFLNLLKFIVVPIVLFSIASGVISMQDIGRVGSVGGKTIVYYMCTTAFAVVLALVLASAAKGMHIFAAMETSGLAYEPPAGQSLMQTIIDIQRPFFLEGDESLLKPMILKDVAERAKLDISTISRVSNSKYVQTNYGIYSLKFFFSDGYTTEDGEELSVREIKRILKECVDNEDKEKPYTDDELADMLKGKGYPIARRTVAKYRQQLNIPVARLRR